jgi:hypothetical protein
VKPAGPATTTAATTRPKSSAIELDGVVYRSVNDAILALSIEKVPRIFHPFGDLPYVLALVLMALGSGAIGAVLRGFQTIKKDAAAKTAAKPPATKPTKPTKSPATLWFILFEPIIGGLIGLAVRALAYVIPAALVDTPNYTLRPNTVAGLSLLIGMVGDVAYEWIAKKVKAYLA